MTVNNINYSTLLFYADNRTSYITESSGIYYWVYFPDIDPNQDSENFLKELKFFSQIRLSLPEEFSKQKFQGKISEVWFDGKENRLFGLNRSKTEHLVEYLKESSENRKEFMKFFKHLSFSRPFYVGMAQNLKTRLSSHISGHGSEILQILEDLKVKKNYVWIGYTHFETEIPDSLIKTHEAIYQKFVKPGLTKKFG